MFLEITLYTIAIVSVLAFYGSHKPVVAELAKCQDSPESETPDGWDKIEGDDPTGPMPATFEPNEDGWTIPNDKDSALVDQFSQFVVRYWTPSDNIVPFKRPDPKVDLSKYGIRELRRIYSERGLKGLRLSRATKAQLLAALTDKAA